MKFQDGVMSNEYVYEECFQNSLITKLKTKCYFVTMNKITRIKIFFNDLTQSLSICFDRLQSSDLFQRSLRWCYKKSCKILIFLLWKEGIKSPEIF